MRLKEDIRSLLRLPTQQHYDDLVRLTFEIMKSHCYFAYVKRESDVIVRLLFWKSAQF